MRNRVKQLITETKISESIELLLEKVFEKIVVNELIIIKSRYNSNEAVRRVNRISHENYSVENNQIISSLLDIVDRIDFEKQEELAEERGEKIIKMLFAGNSPEQTSELHLEKEYIQIRASTRPYRENFITEEIFNFSMDSFFETIKKEKPTVVHLTGHSNKEGMVFLDDKRENIEVVPWKYIVPSVKLFPKSTDCIFINAIYSEEFGKRIAEFFPNVICMKGFVPNTEAIRFPSGFYSSLSINRDYLSAYKVSMNLIADSMKNFYHLPFNGIHYDNSIEIINELGTFQYYKDGVLQEENFITR